MIVSDADLRGRLGLTSISISESSSSSPCCTVAVVGVSASVVMPESMVLMVALSCSIMGADSWVSILDAMVNRWLKSRKIDLIEGKKIPS